MNFLQLHDGPAPEDESLNPYAPGAAVWKNPPLTLISGNGCDPALIYSQFVPQTKQAWENRLGQVDRASKLVKNYSTLKAAAGTGSIPIYDSNGVISGFKPGNKVDEAAAWLQLAAVAITIAKDGVRAGQAQRLKDDAQLLWDENKWGVASVCTQSLPQLDINATNCFNSMKWWLDEQSKAQAAWLDIPFAFRTNLINPQKASRARLANRSVVMRQNALTILVQQIEEKGGKFSPEGGPSGGVSAATILAALSALAFFRF